MYLLYSLTLLTDNLFYLFFKIIYFVISKNVSFRVINFRTSYMHIFSILNFKCNINIIYIDFIY